MSMNFGRTVLKRPQTVQGEIELEFPCTELVFLSEEIVMVTSMTIIVPGHLPVFQSLQ